MALDRDPLINVENYRLNERMRENLTYKLFIFQCINCYFMLAYTAFGHPFGVRLFGIDMGKCEVRRRQARRAVRMRCARCYTR